MLFLLRFFLKCYRCFISPWFSKGCCRFYPSCSEYALLAFERFSTAKACRKILMRILSCHPFHPGGIDFP